MTTDEEQELLAALALPEAPCASAEERLRALEDEREIRELVRLYGYLCDARRWDDLLALYTDDIKRTLGGTLREHVKGKAALREKLVAPTLERRRADDAAAPPPDRLLALSFRHLMASEVVRRTSADEATAVVQYTLVATRDDGVEPSRGAHEGSYVFRFRRGRDGRWRFCAQTIFSDNARNPMFRAGAR